MMNDDTCPECGADATWFHADGLPWCDRCEFEYVPQNCAPTGTTMVPPLGGFRDIEIMRMREWAWMVEHA